MGTTGQSITLANSIIGVGILAMPFCFQQCGALLAILMLLLSALVSRLSCHFLLKSAILARRRNFEFLAFHVFGAPGKLMAEMAIIGFLMGTCIAYFVVVGDLGPQIISKMLNINQSNVLRTCVMVLVSLVCVLPLGLLRNVDSLSNVSAATIGFYLCLIIKVVAEATSQLLTGDWWSKIELWKPEGVLQCLPIFSMALFCQTQLFEIFETLPSLSLEKMNIVTKNAINICTAVYFLLGMFGYIGFCDKQISGNILISLSPTMASDVIKLGFVMSLAFSFPLIIFPCRASLYSLLYRKVLPSHHDHIINHSIPEGTFKCMTVAIIAISLIISLMIPNIELVLGLVGSTIGVMICVIFPAACFVNVTIKNTNERLLAKIVLCLGLITMVLGTYANLQAAESKIDHYDDRYTISQDKIDKIVHDFMESNEKRFHSEDAIIKPDAKSRENNLNKFKAAAVKDSVIQPPNPVAPNIHSAEIIKDTPPKVEVVEKENIKKPQLNEVEGAGDKETANNAIDSNKEDSKTKNNEIKEVKIEIIDSVVENSDKTQENLKIMKQQALIETIKQHDEEQKELIKEQKEILDKIKKTKMEIDQTKKDNIDKEQANKIAVESIKKIANIAIQSLTGVDKSNEPKLNNLLAHPSNALEKVVDIEKIKESKSNATNLESKNQTHINTIISSNKESNNNVNVNKGDVTVVVPDANIDSVNNIISLLENSIKENMGSIDSNFVKELIDQKAPDVVGKQIDKDHVHSPDEPKSYVLGEDTEMQKLNDLEKKLPVSKKDALINNVPVPLVMSQSYHGENVPNANSNQAHIPEINPIKSILNTKKIENDEKINSRDKRDVHITYANLDNRKKCPDADQVDAVDGHIDIKIPQKLFIPEEINFNDVNMLERKNFELNIMHHSRNLKSVDESEPT